MHSSYLIFIIILSDIAYVKLFYDILVMHLYYFIAHGKILWSSA